MIMRMTDPFRALLGLQRALEATRGTGALGLGTTGMGAFPPVNVFRQGEDFVVVAEIPGVKKSELDVQVKNNQVRIAGNKVIGYEETESVHRRERRAGQFNRTIEIPAEVDASKVKAEYRNGILAVFLPRADSDRARSVPVA